MATEHNTRAIALPEKWGEDLLSDFQAKAFVNELATFVQEPQWQDALLDVATVLHKCATHVINLVHKNNEPSAMFLFLLAHNHFLASVRSVSAGQCLATFPTGRATVEFALYSWYLSTNPEAASRWNDKPSNKEKRKKWSYEFSFGNLTNNRLSTISKELTAWAKYLHEFAIEFGAHPNTNAIYSNMQSEHRQQDGQYSLQMMVLHPWNTFTLSTTKFTMETGMIAIELFTHGFPLAVETLNLSQDIARMKHRLRYLQETFMQKAQATALNT